MHPVKEITVTRIGHIRSFLKNFVRLGDHRPRNWRFGAERFNYYRHKLSNSRPTRIIPDAHYLPQRPAAQQQHSPSSAHRLGHIGLQFTGVVITLPGPPQAPKALDNVENRHLASYLAQL